VRVLSGGRKGQRFSCRAAFEAAAYQTREVFDAIYADSHVLLKTREWDGGGTNNKLLMQFQSDINNVPVVKPKSWKQQPWELPCGRLRRVWEKGRADSRFYGVWPRHFNLS
jgi:hypothetical protein